MVFVRCACVLLGIRLVLYNALPSCRGGCKGAQFTTTLVLRLNGW